MNHISNELKIVLTYAPSEQQFLPVPPLGICALSQHLIDNGIKNDIIDSELELWIDLGCKSSEYASMPIEQLNEDSLPVDSLIKRFLNYDVIAFSIMGKRQIPYMCAMAKKIKEISSSAKYIIAGGAFFNEENAQALLRYLNGVVDFIIIGEGWGTLPALIKNLKIEKRMSWNCIPGVMYLESNTVIYTPKKMWKGSLPIPNYNTINREGYLLQQAKLYGIEDSNIVYHLLVGDRNCPYNCSFCRVSKNTSIIKKPEEIADEMIKLNNISGADCFSLVCNEMNPTERYFDTFLDKLLEYKGKIKWFCYLRPEKLTYKTLEKAKSAGCVLIRYGVETGSQRILDLMNKNLCVREMEEIMKKTSSVGIWNHVNIISGYLYEQEDDIKLTLKFIDDNKDYIDSVRVNPFYVPIGSPIHMNPEKYNIKNTKNTGSYIQFGEENCDWETKQILIQKSTELILQKCIDSGINFAGILPFLVAKLMDHFDDVWMVKQWIKEKHNYLNLPVSPDTAKWRLAHPQSDNIEISKWEDIAGKRGSNYQTMLEESRDGKN